MSNKSLLFTHRAKGEREPAISFTLPEPAPEMSITLSQNSNGDIGWQRYTLDAIGIGRYLSYRNYDIKVPTWFTSKVSEPVICLSIRWGNGTMSLSPSKSCVTADGKRHFLFWQGTETLEQELGQGEHTQLDLFIRPESLSHLKDYPQIGGLIEQSAKHTVVDIGDIDIPESEQLHKLVFKIVQELDQGKPTVERFQYLCDSLILFAIGEDIHLTPQENSRVANDVPKGQIYYKARPSEQAMLDELKNMEAPILLAKYKKLFCTVAEKQKQKQMELEVASTLKRHAAKIWGDERVILAGLYFGAAKFLAIFHDNPKPKDKTLIKKAVAKACDLSFELQPPNASELAFYLEWSQPDNPTIRPLDGQLASEFLSMLLPDNSMEFTAEQSRRGQNLLMEQIKEAFGFLSKSEAFGISPNNKPMEIVELYNRLTEYCADTLELNEKEGVKRSDILRELDSAYDLDDYVSLLQIEIEQLCAKSGYVEQQNEQKLKWLIVALRHSEMEYDDFFKQLKTDAVYEDLRLFHTLGNNLNRYKAAVRKQVDRSRRLGFEFSNELRVIVGGCDDQQVEEFAKFILRHEGFK